jgi:hypothetical protein
VDATSLSLDTLAFVFDRFSEEVERESIIFIRRAMRFEDEDRINDGPEPVTPPPPPRYERIRHVVVAEPLH